MKNKKEIKRTFFIYTQSYMHSMQLKWDYDGEKILYYRNHQGLVYLAEIVYRNHQFYIKTKNEKRFHEHTTIKKEQGIVHILMLEEAFISNVYERKDEITIGRDSSCDIQINSSYVSAIHAKLCYTKQGIEIVDLDSANGVYVNHKRIDHLFVSKDDLIHLPFLYILVNTNFIMISYRTSISKIQLHQYHEIVNYEKKRDFIWLQKEPYIKEELPLLKISIKAPPNQITNTRSMWMVLLPALGMGLSTSMMMVSAFQNQTMLSKVTSLVMSGGMLFSSVIFPLIMHHYEHKEEKKKRKKQEKAYHQYYQKIASQMKELQKQYIHIYIHQFVNTYEAILRVHSFKQLWQLDSHSNEKLTIVLGESMQMLPWELEGSDLAIQLEYSPLEREYQKLWDEKNQNVKLPLYFSLWKERLLGIYGVEGLGYALQLLLQICVTHDYRNLSIWICASQQDFIQWGISYLPHILNDDGFRNLLATKEDLITFQHHLRVQEKASMNLLFLANDDLASEFVFDEILKEYPHLFVIQYSLNHQQLSSSCIHVIHVGKNQQGTYFQQQNISFEYRYCEIAQLKETFERLSFIRWKCNHTPPSSFGFLELYDCQNIEQLEIEKRWQKKKDMSTILVPLGYNHYHEKIVLDVHEKAHGPHGVIAGMTGSGKSELIITFILSLCIQYSAQEVSFLLIDYKGGMSANVFQQLPHISYIMSNLNDQSIRRVSLSLQSELQRRQKIFQECSSKYHLGVLDIDKYWQLVEEDKCAPLPHLFVIADEFAELKNAHPEFLNLLKKISRIGRSLGIHLILATQKPSGIIDDEILSNSRFRICLKVAYNQDSNDVLHHEDAANLKEAGSFYLQVGNDEIYVQGKCSYTQSPYLQNDDVPDKKVSFHHYHGKAYLSKQISRQTTSITQLQAIVAYMSNLAKQFHFTSFSLCEAELTMQQQVQFYDQDAIYIGELDDVRSQCRHPFYFQEKGFHFIFGKQGSGKEMFVRTIVYEYAHRRLQTGIYLLTASKNQFDDLKSLLVINDIIDVNHNEAYQSFLYQLKHHPPKQKIIVIVMMYERILECVDSFSDDFMIILQKVDQCIVCGYSSMSIPYRWLPYFEYRHILQVEEKSEYTYVQNGDDVLPEKLAGSGITIMNHQAMLFQIYPYAYSLYQQLPQGESRYRVPLLPEHIEMLFKEHEFYLGKDMDSKEDVFISVSQPIIICALYEIPQIFYDYVEEYEERYQSKLDVSFYHFREWKEHQYDEAFQRRIRNASFIFIGSGLMDCLYAFPYPFNIRCDLKDHELICYSNKQLYIVAAMEETKCKMLM